MTRTISINDATINTDEFRTFYQRSFNLELEIEALKEDLKGIAEEVKSNCKIKPSLYSKFVKARVKAKTKDVVKDGETFAVLDGALDD